MEIITNGKDYPYIYSTLRFNVYHFRVCVCACVCVNVCVRVLVWGVCVCDNNGNEIANINYLSCFSFPLSVLIFVKIFFLHYDVNHLGLLTFNFITSCR